MNVLVYNSGWGDFFPSGVAKAYTSNHLANITDNKRGVRNNFTKKQYLFQSEGYCDK